MVSVPIKSSKIIYSPAWSLNKWIDEGIEFGEMPKRPNGYKVAKYEVTNHQWNEVAEWSVSRGYDLKQVSYSPGEENLPHECGDQRSGQMAQCPLRKARSYPYVLLGSL